MPVRRLWFFAASALFLAVWYACGLEYYLFWRLWWYDIVAHCTGGIIIGFATSFALEAISLQRRIWWGILAALLIGICWEMFEWWLGLLPNVFMGYALDTTKDILMDTLGGALGVLIFRRI